VCVCVCVCVTVCVCGTVDEASKLALGRVPGATVLFCS
jgi:hypothetical protein